MRTFNPLISTVSMYSSHSTALLSEDNGAAGAALAVLMMVPSIVNGNPPEYLNPGKKSDRNGTAPTLTSNLFTSLPFLDMI